jgi:putative endonuclease
MATDNTWWVYMIETEKGALYTGITTDVRRRFEQHQTKKGAKYFYQDKPIRIVYQEMFACRSSASKREYEIKQWPSNQKKIFVQQRVEIDSSE